MEETQVRSVKSLKGMKGNSTGSEPVAMIAFFALMLVFLPSSPSTLCVHSQNMFRKIFTLTAKCLCKQASTQRYTGTKLRALVEYLDSSSINKSPISLGIFDLKHPLDESVTS